MNQVFKSLAWVLVFGLFPGFLVGANPLFFQRQLPTEFLKAAPLARPRDFRALERFSLGNLQVTTHRENSVDLHLPQARPLAFSGMPKVPQLLRVFKIGARQRAQAYLENIVVEESSTALPVSKVSEAYVWSIKRKLKFNSKPGGRYFPGQLIQSRQNRDSLFVNLFPVQVDLWTGKILKVTSADIKVAYSEEPLTLVTELVESPSIIVTSSKLQRGAELLKKYHEEKLGIKTSVVTVEEIAASETPIGEELLPSGYKLLDQRDNAVKPYQPDKDTGYNYELARKISHYLQKRMHDSSPLKYVTILGNSQIVPPSYYFAYYVEVSRNFTPTDACYGAVEKCTEPKVAVGRLPLVSEEEIKNYIAKAESWRAFSEQSSQELSLFGGKAFPQADIYVGELGTLGAIQDPKLDWQGVRKNFKTQKRYLREGLAEVVKGESQTPFAYHLDHGNGNEWYVENEFISSNDVVSLSAKASANRPSVMVSVSCTNAAFDEQITNESIFEDANRGNVSIGTSLVRSSAGVVAYLGSARPAIGMPVYQFDDFGNVELTGTNYGLQILESFYQKYGIYRRGRVGDFSLKALQAFVFENGNNMETDENLWSYFITELLGDPVIPLPNRVKSSESFEPGKSALKLDNSVGFGFPVLRLKDFTGGRLPLSLAKPVEATLLKILENDFGGYLGEELISTQVINESEEAGLSLDASNTLSEGKYFLRLENTLGVPRERQIYFSVE